MSLASNIHELLLGGGTTSTYSYTINNSLRFRSSASAYLSRTPASAGNRQTWTWSGWVKRGALSTQQTLFGASNGGASSGDWMQLVYDGTTNAIDFIYYASGAVGRKITTPIYRDISSWYHVVAIFNTTSATGEDRMQLWINGVRVTSFSTNTILAQNTNGTVNNTQVHEIGALYYTPNTNFFDGYLAEINFIDGQALDPSYFGATNTTTGTWAPKRYSGSYGTNGFYLPFSDTSGLTSGSNTGLGKDFSGNGNYFNSTNISLTAGSTYDAMLDSPTPKSSTVGNYAVLNPLDAYSGTLVDGNLYWYGTYGGQNGHGARSTIQVRPAGKWYVEAYNTTVAGSGNSCMLGFTASTQPLYTSAFASALTPWIGVDASVFGNKIKFYSLGVSGSLADGTVLFASYASGDIVNFAIDFDAGKIWVGKAGTWYNSGNPASGTNATATFSVGSAAWAFWAEYVAASDNSNISGAVLNFGQRPFAYTPPTGFKALQTYNLPTPAIKKGNQHFDATLWTGNGTSQTITNSGGFAPDFVWAKLRSGIDNNRLADTIRGANKLLSSNLTDAENSALTTVITGFTSSGFTIGSDGSVNTNNSTYVGWQWKGGGTAVTNTNGSITSQVSANPTAGFSVVTYTGTGSAATVGHGLGVAPSMIIVKNRTTAATSWITYHSALLNTQALYLNTTDAVQTSNLFWNNTSPTSSVFSVAAYNPTNQSTANIVAYCFAAIPGYSAFGSYVGNSSADGVFIHTGFRPRWIMIKSSTGAYNWVIFDAMRLGYNYDATYLLANSSNAEGTDPAPGTGSWAIDILSNGFKNRDSAVTLNNSGQTYIYAAFAENPFQYALAR